MRGFKLPLAAMLFGLGMLGCELFSDKPASRVPQSEPAEPESVAALREAGLDVTPAEDYLFPLFEGSAGSAWCVCRGVGTSPHIGQDYVNAGAVRSVAVANARVEKVEFLGGGCGWAVTLQDGLGAEWRYLHLNKPALTEGQVLAKGTEIGTHKDYPTPACGTGPHLHLDRFEAGSLPPVASAGRACKNGFRSCNFNPVRPLVDKTQLGLPDKPAAKSAKKGAKKSTKPAPKSAKNATTPPPAPLCSSAQAAPVALTADDEPALNVRREAPAESVIGVIPELQIEEKADGTGRHPFTLSGVELLYSGGGAGKENLCDADGAEGGRERCVVRWELHARDANQVWWRVIASQDARNRPIRVEADKRFCLPAGADRYLRFVAYTESGRVLGNELSSEE